jgi:chlorite dismutase
MTQRLFGFAGGEEGTWEVISMKSLIGIPLPSVRRVEMVTGDNASPDATWLLRGITSNERYVTRDEKTQLLAAQRGLARPEATHAALIPIRKNPAWWALPQDERRAIMEERSHHTRIGLNYLPAVARRLHHCRDLGPNEPFDFLTWFEFAPEYAVAFDRLLDELRATDEWHFVDRETEVRLRRG